MKEWTFSKNLQHFNIHEYPYNLMSCFQGITAWHKVTDDHYVIYLRQTIYCVWSLLYIITINSFGNWFTCFNSNTTCKTVLHIMTYTICTGKCINSFVYLFLGDCSLIFSLIPTRHQRVTITCFFQNTSDQPTSSSQTAAHAPSACMSLQPLTIG